MSLTGGPPDNGDLAERDTDEWPAMSPEVAKLVVAGWDFPQLFELVEVRAAWADPSRRPLPFDGADRLAARLRFLAWLRERGRLAS